MKTIRLLMMAMIMTSLSLGLVAKSEGRGDKRKHFKELMDQLSLSEKQIEGLKTFRKSNKGKKKEIRKEIRDLREQMKASFISGTSDADLKALHVKMGSLRTRSSDLRFEKMVFMKNTLDKKQREKFMELRRSHRKNRDH